MRQRGSSSPILLAIVCGIATLGVVVSVATLGRIHKNDLCYPGEERQGKICVPKALGDDKPRILQKYGIDIDYPDTWQTQVYYAPESPNDAPGTAKAKESPALLNSIEILDLFPESLSSPDEGVSIQLNLEKLPEPMSLEEAREEVALKKLEVYGDEGKLGAYHNNVSDLREVEIGSRHKAYQFTYSRFDGEQDIKGMVVFTTLAPSSQENQELYIFHYQAEESKYDRYLSMADSMAKSMRLLSPDEDIELVREGDFMSGRKNTFFCETIGGLPTIMANHYWGNVPLFRFEDDSFENWTQQERCEEIATRLVDYHQRGLLVHLEFAKVPKSLYRAAEIILSNQATTKDLSLLDAMQIAMNTLDIGELARESQERIPVICTSAEAGDHAKLPADKVGLLMTLKDSDNPEEILETIENIPYDPETVLVH